MTAVFAAQGWGQFCWLIFSRCRYYFNETRAAAALVGIVVVQAYKNSILHAQFPAIVPVDYAWRLLIGLGCVPGVIALYFRLTIPETPRFTMDIERNVAQATSDIENVLATGKYVVDQDAPVIRAKAPRASRADFAKYFGQWKNMKVLIGTAYSWFALDVGPYFSLMWLRCRTFIFRSLSTASVLTARSS
jgi:PHS family inorganic phosphate transporter-like MFS transporter